MALSVSVLRPRILGIGECADNEQMISHFDNDPFD